MLKSELIKLLYAIDGDPLIFVGRAGNPEELEKIWHYVRLSKKDYIAECELRKQVEVKDFTVKLSEEELASCDKWYENDCQYSISDYIDAKDEVDSTRIWLG